MKCLEDKQGQRVLAYIGGLTAAAVALKFYHSRQKNQKRLQDLRDNPFLHDRRKPPPVGKLEPKDKKKATKKTITETKLDQFSDTHYDVICIGSGAGSLTTAALLARAGRKVLILEQHSKLGGCCHTFKEGRFEFDTGLHYIGNMQPRSQTFRTLDQLSQGQIQWAPMDSVYDELIIGDRPENFKRFNFFGGYNNWKKALLEYFPNEEKAIDAFAKLLKQSSTAEIAFGILKMTPNWVASLFLRLRFIKPMNLFHLYYEKTTYEVIAQLTSNAELQACFSYIWGDYGVPPKKGAFIMNSGANAHYIKHGAFYPKNGPAIIPYYLIKPVLQSNGTFFTRAAVKQILLRTNAKKQLEAFGVEVDYGKDSTLQFTADVIVSGAGVRNTFQRLIPREITSKACPDANWLLNEGQPSISYLNLFVGFSETSAELNLPARNNWVIKDSNFDDLFNQWISFDDPFEALEKVSLPLLFIGFPSAKDPNYDYNNKRGSTCVAITLCPYRWFEMWNDLPLGKRGDQYEALKSAFSDKIWEKIVELFPQVADKREVCILGSPVTSNHYLHTEYGEIYGLAHNMKRFSAEFLRRTKPKTEINGLYLTGQDITTCGVSSAITAGIMTACQVLKRDVFDDLARLYNRLEAAR